MPKGYVRLLGKLAELTDSGIPIYIFTGNHDMWMFDYLEKEINLTIYREPIETKLNGKIFFLGHGDGLGPGDDSYKFLKKIFSNAVCKWIFARIHPNLGISIAEYWSRKSRISTGTKDNTNLGGKEFLVQFCKRKIKETQIDYFLFGHRHLPMQVQISENSTYINLGEWVNYRTYAVFNGETVTLKEFD